MIHLSIDLETYSDVNLKKAGLYRYVQSPAFEILLLRTASTVRPLRSLIWRRAKKSRWKLSTP